MDQECTKIEVIFEDKALGCGLYVGQDYMFGFSVGITDKGLKRIDLDFQGFTPFWLFLIKKSFGIYLCVQIN